ncbi:MAG: DUF427 domain-containing protein [Anaerolineae bacterium]|jgi:uncharacterized protein (DUF427 family)
MNDLASYFEDVVDGRGAERAGWTYHEPSEGFEAIKDHAVFHSDRMDA